jgi:hypothetical protein
MPCVDDPLLVEVAEIGALVLTEKLTEAGEAPVEYITDVIRAAIEVYVIASGRCIQRSQEPCSN